jgi:hypothetical protein
MTETSTMQIVECKPQGSSVAAPLNKNIVV